MIPKASLDPHWASTPTKNPAVFLVQVCFPHLYTHLTSPSLRILNTLPALTRYPGSTFMDHVLRYQDTPGVKMIVVLGEVSYF